MCKPCHRPVLVLISAFLSLITIAGWNPVRAASIAETLPFTAAFHQQDQIAIPVTSRPGSAAVDFAAPMAEKQGILCVKFRAFLNMDSAGGWGNYLRLNLNGKPLGANMPDGSERLINRRGTCVTTDNHKMPWWDKDYILSFFGPEGELDQSCHPFLRRR